MICCHFPRVARHTSIIPKPRQSRLAQFDPSMWGEGNDGMM
jgi:hypothetical protein